MSNLPDRIVLRPVDPQSDEEFLIGLYYTTRDDIHMAEIDAEQKKTLSLMQYVAQKQHFEAEFPDSKHDIIMFDGKSIGRLWTARYGCAKSQANAPATDKSTNDLNIKISVQL